MRRLFLFCKISMDRYEFIWKSVQKFEYKFDYREVGKIKNSKSKVVLICPIHGVFMQEVGNHLRSAHGCTECGKEARGKSNRDTKDSWIIKAIKRHGDFYNYSKVRYIDCYTPVTIICPIHGEFQQVPYYHTSENGCPKCGNIKKNANKILTTEEFVEKAKSIHGTTYSYDAVEYETTDSKVCIICPIHGEFWQTPHSHLQGHGCPYCNHLSKGEEYVKNVLNELGINYIWQYCIKTDKKHYNIDFYLPEYNLAIEHNGEQHYKFSPYFHKTEENFIKQKQRDSEVKDLLYAKNIKLHIISYRTPFEKVKIDLEKLLK